VLYLKPTANNAAKSLRHNTQINHAAPLFRWLVYVINFRKALKNSTEAVLSDIRIALLDRVPPLDAMYSSRQHAVELPAPSAVHNKSQWE